MENVDVGMYNLIEVVVTGVVNIVAPFGHYIIA